jgi:hypothetical protein
MTLLRQQMLENMQLRGLAARTQESYLAAVRQLATHFHRSPDLLTEDELHQYFLYLPNQKRVAPNTSNVALNAVKFLYLHTRERPWPLGDLVRPPKARPPAASTSRPAAMSASAQPRHSKSCTWPATRRSTATSKSTAVCRSRAV